MCKHKAKRTIEGLLCMAVVPMNFNYRYDILFDAHINQHLSEM